MSARRERPPRVTSALFVAALIRRVQIAGAQAVLVRHGAEEAGAIFLSVDHLDGTLDLYSPAAQSAFADEADGEAQVAAGGRLFTRVRERVAEEEIQASLAREMRFDPDLWLVAIEDREGRAFVDVIG